jgi:hypothetical protein
MKKIFIIIFDLLLDKEIRLGDTFVMNKKGHVFIFRPSKNKILNLKDKGRIIQKCPIEDIHSKGDRVVYNLAKEAAKDKGCDVKRIYTIKKGWAWAAKITCVSG